MVTRQTKVSWEEVIKEHFPGRWYVRWENTIIIEVGGDLIVLEYDKDYACNRNMNVLYFKW